MYVKINYRNTLTVLFLIKKKYSTALVSSDKILECLDKVDQNNVTVLSFLSNYLLLRRKGEKLKFFRKELFNTTSLVDNHHYIKKMLQTSFA